MIVTRFAPSPTGRLHLGHAFSAVIAHDQARSDGGTFLLRIEDLDQGRSRAEFVAGIIEDLRWLGLDWGKPPLVQSERGTVYAQAIDRLRVNGLVYPCFCTRSDIAAALAAPHGRHGDHYPGTCRQLPDDPSRRKREAHCWRLNSAIALERVGLPSWIDDGERLCSSPTDFDDAVLARRDAPAAYHLACVLDDCASGVTLVTRGADLQSSTPVQRLLQKLLALPEPAYFHHRLVGHADGRRLAKRDQAPTLEILRQGGVDGPDLSRQLRNGQLPLGFAFLED